MERKKGQDKLKKLIELKEKKLSLLQEERSVNQIEGREFFLNRDINNVKQEITQNKNQLRRLENVQKAVQKSRDKKRI